MNASTCNCCCGCQKPFSADELAFYKGVTSLETSLCFECQEEYERETDAKTSDIGQVKP